MSLSGMVEIPRLQAKRSFVMPAQAGIQVPPALVKSEEDWIPASAGMTEKKVDFQSTLSESLGLEPRVVQSSLLDSNL